MNSLEEIRTTLHTALGSPALFSLVNTRIVLKTGVDLAEIREADDKNSEAISKVLSALASMGYSPEALALVARRKK